MPFRPPTHRPPRPAPPPRPTAAARGYGGRWQRERAVFLAQHPLCADCQAEGSLTSATVVDHVVPHCGDYELMWDQSNWRPLCKPHHDRKTATRDGAFGRPKVR